MQEARKRLVYDEFFLFSLAMLSNKDKKVREGRVELKGVQESVLESYIKKLSFKLTNDQRSAIIDIVNGRFLATNSL